MAKINWDNLGFDYVSTKSFIRYIWKDGKWDQGTLLSDPSITLNLASTVFHYGQSCFEGLKAFHMKDGKIRIFRPHLNATRLYNSCKALSLEPPPLELFLEAVQRVVQDNKEYVPPYGINGSLYIRPFVIGTEPLLGLSPSNQVQFLVFVNPVGSYYSGEIGKPVKALIQYGFDRASANGTGHVKVGGNYAPCYGPTLEAKKKGYTVTLFLDSKESKYIEEFSTSNFAALTAPDESGVRCYVTPKSKSILPSVTNRSLSELARRRFGWKVERRPITWEEVKNGAFQEVAACGTAVVITPIGEIDRQVVISKTKVPVKGLKTPEEMIWEDEIEKLDLDLERVTLSDNIEGFVELYNAYRALQSGDLDNWQEFEWMWPLNGL